MLSMQIEVDLAFGGFQANAFLGRCNRSKGWPSYAGEVGIYFRFLKEWGSGLNGRIPAAPNGEALKTLARERLGCSSRGGECVLTLI